MNFEEKELAIQKFLKRNKITYIKINGEDELNIIYDLYMNDLIPITISESINPYVYKAIGDYYRVKKDNNNRMKFYLIGAEKKEKHCLHKIGYHYEKKGDEENAIKYYELGAENGGITCINNLGCLYYKKVKRIYLTNHKKCDSYFNNDCNVILMKKYYNMLFQKGKKTTSIIININIYLNYVHDVEYAQKYYDILNDQTYNKYKNEVFPICEL